MNAKSIFKIVVTVGALAVIVVGARKSKKREIELKRKEQDIKDFEEKIENEKIEEYSKELEVAFEDELDKQLKEEEA